MGNTVLLSLARVTSGQTEEIHLAAPAFGRPPPRTPSQNAEVQTETVELDPKEVCDASEHNYSRIIFVGLTAVSRKLRYYAKTIDVHSCIDPY